MDLLAAGGMLSLLLLFSFVVVPLSTQKVGGARPEGVRSLPLVVSHRGPPASKLTGQNGAREQALRTEHSPSQRARRSSERAQQCQTPRLSYKRSLLPPLRCSASDVVRRGPPPPADAAAPGDRPAPAPRRQTLEASPAASCRSQARRPGRPSACAFGLNLGPPAQRPQLRDKRVQRRRPGGDSGGRRRRGCRGARLELGDLRRKLVHMHGSSIPTGR